VDSEDEEIIEEDSMLSEEESNTFSGENNGSNVRGEIENDF
jgi:hypothetical protein